MKFVTFGALEARIAGGVDREGSGDGPVVVLLHGFGAPGEDLVPLWRTIDAPPGTRFVFPVGPIDLGGPYRGGRAWWYLDLEERARRAAAGMARDVSEVPAGLDEARGKLEGLLDATLETLRPASGAFVLGGFSQGSMLAFDVALRIKRPLAGVIVMSGSHIAADEWSERYVSRRGLPVFMSHGDADPLLPFGIAEKLRDTLREAGLAVDWVPFRGGHAIPQAVIDGLGAFLRRVLR